MKWTDKAMGWLLYGMGCGVLTAWIAPKIANYEGSWVIPISGGVLLVGAAINGIYNLRKEA